MTVVYKCATCGAVFYYYGIRGQILRDLIHVSEQIQKEFNFEIPTAWKVVEQDAKCCKSPLLYRHTYWE